MADFIKEVIKIVYSFIDMRTHMLLGVLHLSVELKRGHRFSGFGHTYIVADVTQNTEKSAVAYLEPIA